jgi:hypothetical protein
MAGKLNQYTISLSIRDIKRTSNLRAFEQITGELAMRPHFLCNSITKVDDGESEEIRVEISCWALTRESAEKLVAEELFEIVCAVLDNPEGISVHIVN